MRRSRLARRHPHYVNKYFDVTPHDYPFSVRVIARTKRHARRLLKTFLKRDYEWTPQEWKEFLEHNLRLGKVERVVSLQDTRKASG